MEGISLWSLANQKKAIGLIGEGGSSLGGGADNCKAMSYCYGST